MQMCFNEPNFFLFNHCVYERHDIRKQLSTVSYIYGQSVPWSGVRGT